MSDFYNNENNYGGNEDQNNIYREYDRAPEQNNTPPNYNRGYKRQATGFGTASLVLGIIALVFFLFFINIPVAILSIVFGVIQIAGYEKKGLAIGGIVTSILSVVFCIVAWALIIGNMLSDPEFENLYEDIYNNGYGYRYEFHYEFPEDGPDQDLGIPDLDTDLPRTDL